MVKTNKLASTRFQGNRSTCAYCGNLYNAHWQVCVTVARAEWPVMADVKHTPISRIDAWGRVAGKVDSQTGFSVAEIMSLAAQLL